MKGEKLSLLQRCIKWREANIKEKQFILILSFLVGIFTAFAALILKFFIHQIQNFLTDNFNATEANYLYLVYPVVGIFLAGWFVRNIVKDDISHGVTKFYMLFPVDRDVSSDIISGPLPLPVRSPSGLVDRLEQRRRLY